MEFSASWEDPMEAVHIPDGSMNALRGQPPMSPVGDE